MGITSRDRHDRRSGAQGLTVGAGAVMRGSSDRFCLGVLALATREISEIGYGMVLRV